MAWRDLILENLWLKVFSLLLAALIWFAARANLKNNPASPPAFAFGEIKRDFPERPIFVLAPPGDPRTFAVEPASANVTVSAPPALIEQLKESEVRVFVRAPDPAGTAESMPLRVHVPRGIHVLGFEPEAVRVTVRENP